MYCDRGSNKVDMSHMAIDVNQFAELLSNEKINWSAESLLGCFFKNEVFQYLEWWCFSDTSCNFKVAEEVMPPAAVLKAAKFLANVIPEVKFFPTQDLAELAFRNLKYRKLVCLWCLFWNSKFI